MKFFDILRTANHNLFRNKVRTALTILAIFVGSFTIILNVAINAGVNSFIDDQISTIGGEDYLIIMKGDASSMMSSMGGSNSDVQEYDEDGQLEYMNGDDIAKIKAIDGITGDVTERGNGVMVDYIKGAKNDKRFRTSGAGSMPAGNFKVPVTAGEIPSADIAEDLIALEAGYPEALGYENDEDIIGETVILGVKDPVTGKFSEFKAKVAGVQAAGIVAFNGNAVTKQLEDKLSEVYDQYYTEAQKDTYAAVQTSFDTAKYTEDEIKEKLREAGYTGMTVNDMVGMIKTFFDVILIVFSIFGGIALLAAAIGIVNTLFMSVEERTREIGLDKALGMSSRRVYTEFATEAILLGFWGSVVGVGVAMAVGTATNTAVHAPGGFLEVFPTFDLFKFTVNNILPIVIIVMFIAFLAGTIPAWKAAHKNPIETLRYE